MNMPIGNRNPYNILHIVSVSFASTILSLKGPQWKCSYTALFVISAIASYQVYEDSGREFLFNPIQDGLFWGCSRMGALFGSPSLKSATHSYNDETWHSYTLPKEDPKNV